MANSYCDVVAAKTCHPCHIDYHDNEYGFAVDDDNVLFERLILEINQAGLSWETILKRREGYAAAYESFKIDRIAGYGEDDVERLMQDARIIRNRAKILAAIHNAQVVQSLQETHGSFKGWLDAQPAMPLEDWVKLFRKTFKFVGPEIVNEFLVSTGYLRGAHDKDCARYQASLASNPPWAKKR
jgi:DNA-3-methyladenine glycosylase I